MKLTVLICCVLFYVPCAFGQDTTTGNVLRDKCRDFFAGQDNPSPATMDFVNTGYCAGYLDAVLSVEQAWRLVEGKSSKAAHFCLPNDVPKGQMFLVIKKWMDDHPEELHTQAAFIIHQAFLKAFPCK